MELKEFIEETLINVVEGVDSANKKTNRFKLIGDIDKEFSNSKKGTYIDFDVSLIAKESTEAGKKGGIAVALANVMAGKSKETKQTESNANTHRIKFKIFVSTQEYAEP